jgi:hypothetical protein
MDSVITQLERLIEHVATLAISDDLHAVERFDIGQIKQSLTDVVDEIKYMQEYRSTPGIDYQELWNQRQLENQELEEAKQSWIQTEIFKLLLRP